ncbi:PREDICTED: serine/threonine-protein kinase D2-like [Ceratotherium simum simum]|uniref:Serine/threonine-protein kinase D2-like n=1 Tax=Ceratotherium simum simum TaxID=73337 RepID=A0ABM1DBB4_CERSS|nr:PREDICTED: serine/threonine-protein kinase D2-like [Ceratotherium simum simum]
MRLRALTSGPPGGCARGARARRYRRQPEELTSSLHSFKNKAFKKAKVCGVCKQIIDGQGSSCRACKYSCHKKCEAKVVIPRRVQVHLEQLHKVNAPFLEGEGQAE